jgi:BMFP domain-containing protein YqiC
VTREAKDALEAAIKAAGDASRSVVATQAEIDAAVTALNEALAVFNAARKEGAKDFAVLSLALSDAEAAKAGVVAATAAANVPVGMWWVTQAQMDALNTAIGAAQTVFENAAATQAQIAAAANTLATATTTFADAKREGTSTQAHEDAALFTEAHGAIAAKTFAAVVVADKEAVEAAIAAYNGLSDAAKILLPATLANLQALLARIDALEEEAAFTAAHGAIVDKAVGTVAIADKEAVEAALAAHNDLSPAAKALLPGDTLAKLQTLLSRIDTLEAAAGFAAAHGAITDKSVGTVAIADRGAVEAAVAAYNGLGAATKALLSNDTPTKLQALLARIDTLEEAAAFTATHGATAALDPATVGSDKKAAVNAAIGAYNALSAAAQTLLPGETLTKLQALRNAIDKLEAPQVSAAFTAAHGDTVAMALDLDSVVLADKAKINAAIGAYNALTAAAKALLDSDTPTKLQALQGKINELEAQAFAKDHEVILAKTVETVATSDKDAIEAAFAAYEKLGAAVKALLVDELATLRALRSGISGRVTITLGFTDDGSLLGTAPGSLIITRSESFAVTAAVDLEDIRWSLNGVDIPAPRGAAPSITIAGAQYPVGSYRLGLAARKNGVDYSTELTFTVTD